MSAELLDDLGAASADPGSFFRSPEFLAAEGVTHTLLFGEGVRIPLVVREIEGSELRDAISPYGYPGGTLAPGAAAPDPAALDLAGAGLVSAFIRDAIGAGPCLAGGTVRGHVQVCDPAEASGLRKRLGEQIRRNERRGWSAQAIPGVEVTDSELQAFEGAYEVTMKRTGAARRYFFDSDYFRGILSAPTAWLVLARLEDAEPSAGAIAVRSDDFLHYFLGGTADEALADSPMKNLFAAMMDLSSGLEIPLSLGGGLSPGDSLESFKRGFANRTAEFLTHELVGDPKQYARLSAGRDAGDFFPAYRAS